jgi:transposase
VGRRLASAQETGRGGAYHFVGLDVHKATIAVCVAEAGRDGEVRFVGEIPNEPAALDRLVARLGRGDRELRFAYEAGPCGYGVYRHLRARGHDCVVVAPSLIPRRPGERTKTDRRDATALGRLHRAGELTPVWVPDPEHEAMRDLVRARADMAEALRKARQRLNGFLLRHGRNYDAKRWTWRHREWLADQAFPHPAQQIAAQEYLDAVNELEARVERLTGRIRDLVPGWSMAPVVEALQAMRGVSLVAASALVAEVGDMRRFDTPRQLMAYLGLVPSEHSSGAKRRQETAAGRHHQGGQPARPAHAGGGRLDLQASGPGVGADEAAAGGPAARGARDRVEGAGAALRPLPPPARGRQAAAGGRHRDRARDAGLRLGDRAHGGAARRAPQAPDSGRCRPSAGRRPSHGGDASARRRERSGEPSQTLRGGRVPNPAPRQRQPRDDHGRAVPNPRIRAGSTVARHPAS